MNVSQKSKRPRSRAHYIWVEFADHTTVTVFYALPPYYQQAQVSSIQDSLYPQRQMVGKMRCLVGKVYGARLDWADHEVKEPSTRLRVCVCGITVDRFATTHRMKTRSTKTSRLTGKRLGAPTRMTICPMVDHDRTKK